MACTGSPTPRPGCPRPGTRLALRAGVMLLSLMLVQAAARAQGRPLLRAGARVRLVVHLHGADSLVSGSLLVFTPDTVTIVPRHSAIPASFGLRDIMWEHLSPVPFALRDVTRFQVNRGKPRQIVYGAPIAGAALGALFGATALGPDAGCDIPGNTASDCHWITSGTIVGAAGGVVLCSVAVQLLVHEVWQDVPLTAFSLGAAQPGGRGIAIGIALPVR